MANEKETVKKRGLRNRLISLGVSGMAAVGLMGNAQGENADPLPDAQPALTQPVEATTAQTQTTEQAATQDQAVQDINPLPAVNPAKVTCTMSEMNSNAKVQEGLNTADNFSDLLNSIIVREVKSRLQSGMNIGDASYNACLDIMSGIDGDVKNPPIGCAHGRSQLRTSFSTPVAIVTRDAPTVLNTVCMRSKYVAANLNGHTEDEAVLMLDTFGRLLADPQLLKTAATAAAKDPEGTAEMQKNVLRRTAMGLESGMSAHEALCQAVLMSAPDVVKGDAKAFFVYANVNRTMQGKSKADQIQALAGERAQMNANDGSWTEWVKNNSDLLLGASAGAFALAWFLGRKKSK